MSLREIEVRVPLRCERAHAEILLRDQGRAFEHFVRGVSQRYRPGALSMASRWGGGTVEIVGEEVRMHARVSTIGLPIALSKRTLRPKIARFLERKFSTSYRASGPKIFAIGFQRTGTLSLHLALNQVGILSIHGAPWLLDEARRGAVSSPLYHEYTAFLDNPFPPLFQQLDEAFPGSKFILTVRDTEKWLESVQWLMKLLGPGFEMERWLYGVSRFDPVVFRARYEAHNRAVASYFAGRSDLLTLDLSKGLRWEPLCEFLGVGVPDAPFPHQNRSGGGGIRLPWPLRYGS